MGSVLSRYCPAMTLHNGSSNRQSHAHPGGFRCVEGLEYLLRLFSGNTMAAVRRRKFRPIIKAFSTNNDHPLRNRLVGGGVDGVHNQIYKYLLQLNSIGLYR